MACHSGRLVSGTRLVRRHGYKIFQEGGHLVPFPSLPSPSHVPFSTSSFPSPVLLSPSLHFFHFFHFFHPAKRVWGAPIGSGLGRGCRMHLHCQPQNHYLWTQNGNNFVVLKISIQKDTHLKSYNIFPMSVKFWHRLTLWDVIKGLANRETVIIVFGKHSAGL